MEELNNNMETAMEETAVAEQANETSEDSNESSVSTEEVLVTGGVAALLVGAGYGLNSLNQHLKEKHEARKEAKNQKKAAKKPLIVKYLEGKGYEISKKEPEVEDSAKDENPKTEDSNKKDAKSKK